MYPTLLCLLTQHLFVQTLFTTGLIYIVVQLPGQF